MLRALRLVLFFRYAVQYFEDRGVLTALPDPVNLMPVEHKTSGLVIDERNRAQRTVQDDHGGIVAKKNFKRLFAVRAFNRKCFDHGAGVYLRVCWWQQPI
jgi:hypothetical protein